MDTQKKSWWKYPLNFSGIALMVILVIWFGYYYWGSAVKIEPQWEEVEITVPEGTVILTKQELSKIVADAVAISRQKQVSAGVVIPADKMTEDQNREQQQYFSRRLEDSLTINQTDSLVNLRSDVLRLLSQYRVASDNANSAKKQSLVDRRRKEASRFLAQAKNACTEIKGMIETGSLKDSACQRFWQEESIAPANIAVQ